MMSDVQQKVGKENWKKKKRKLLGESELFQEHKPSEIILIVRDYSGQCPV